jgi:hypothetical protein
LLRERLFCAAEASMLKASMGTMELARVRCFNIAKKFHVPF